MTRILIIGGGPAGYESALVAAQLGAQVTIVDHDGLGGACVLTDCVPSKALIATSAKFSAFRDAPALGVTGAGDAHVDLKAVNERIKDLAQHQSEDVRARLVRENVEVIHGFGRFAAKQSGRVHRIEVVDDAGTVLDTVEADVVLLATGGTPAHPG